MTMPAIIFKKREGRELTEADIKFWISEYVKGNVPDYQSAAMCMAIFFRGMTDKEIAILTDVMEHSGDICDLSAIAGVKVDKHSTGGVGDKTSLVLGPMVVACGAKMAKMSGRGLGFTGGTLDKLESIPGFSVNLTDEQFIHQVNDIGISIIGQTKALVPADKKLYALRDVTGTVESIPLISSSVMSKKLASGADTILLDVTVGSGAFMKDYNHAFELASTMVKIGKNLKRNTIALISNMDEPLGNAIGNNLEVKEAIEALHGRGPEDLMELCYTAGSIMLVQANIYKTREEARVALHKVIEDGSAFDKFVELVEAQGGNAEYIYHPEKFNLSKNIVVVRSEKSGYVKKIKTSSVGILSMQLGAGREVITDKINHSAGIIVFKKVGDKVEVGDPLFEIHTDKKDFLRIIKKISDAYEFSDTPVEPNKVILGIVE